MLADARPFVIVLRRVDPIGFDLVGVFNGHAQAIVGLDTCLDQLLYKQVGEGEVIACGVVDVRIKIAENIGDIHILAAAEGTAHVVETGVGNARLGEVVKIGVLCRRCDGRLTACVQGLYAFQLFACVKFDGCHKGTLLVCRYLHFIMEGEESQCKTNRKIFCS